MTIESPGSSAAPSKRLPLIGFVTSFIYLAGFAFFSLQHREDFNSLGPDGWANFLAGAFAPLAFLWLVLGFIQQGHELRQSAQALHLQAEELKNSVEQQRALVETTREQIDLERQVLKENRDEQARRTKPNLRAQSGGGMTSSGVVTRDVMVENFGATCTNVNLEIFQDGERQAVKQQPQLQKGETAIVRFSAHPDQEISGMSLVCRYVDQQNAEGVSWFEILDEGPPGDHFSFKVVPTEKPAALANESN